MCGTCQAVREAMDAAERITKEEVETLFREAEDAIRRCEKIEPIKD